MGENLAEIVAAAAQLNVWVVGGGELAGQFLDVGALDEIVLTVAPVALAAGSPLFPRRVESDGVRLAAVLQRGQFVDLTFAIAPPRATPSH